MRLAIVGGLLASFGCSYSMTGESRGETARHYRGGVRVVFTNATPDAMCGLYLSFDDDDEYGDNWLPAAGLAAGQSIDFAVRRGKYKARWDTCRPASKVRPYYAATMFREMAFEIGEPTQLFAYVASGTAPTKLAAPRWDLKMVRFQGQPVSQDPTVHGKRYVAKQAPVERDKPARSIYMCRFCVSGAPNGIENPFTEPVIEVERVDMSAYVDKKPGKKIDPKAVKGPSLRRNHDVVQARTNYRIRQ